MTIFRASGFLIVGMFFLMAFALIVLTMSKDSAEGPTTDFGLSASQEEAMLKMDFRFGFQPPIGNYQLRSIDGGDTWYVLGWDGEVEKRALLGLAEDVFPGLVELIDARNTAREYAQSARSIPQKIEEQTAEERAIRAREEQALENFLAQNTLPEGDE